MPFLADGAMDALLSYIDGACDALHICSALPTSLANVTSFTLGNKATPAISAPENGDVSGRKIVVSAITDGSVTGTGTASHWALVDTGTELLAAHTLTASQAVTSGNTFTLSAFSISIPDPS